MDYKTFKEEYDEFQAWDWVKAPVVFGGAQDDRVNHPSHYTSGKTEVIEIIEDAIKTAPSNQAAMLQAQVLKYLLRMWLKDNPKEDARKAQWYLTRLIDKL